MMVDVDIVLQLVLLSQRFFGGRGDGAADMSPQLPFFFNNPNGMKIGVFINGGTSSRLRN